MVEVPLENGTIQILCAALADQAARETPQAGVFTRVLLEQLRADAALLTLPLDLQPWFAAVDGKLTSPHIRVLREVGELTGEPEATTQRETMPHDTNGEQDEQQAAAV